MNRLLGIARLHGGLLDFKFFLLLLCSLLASADSAFNDFYSVSFGICSFTVFEDVGVVAIFDEDGIKFCLQRFVLF